VADVLDEIARELKDNKVVVYMKGTPSFPMCGFSAATVQVLREVGVPFKAIDVLAEPEKREAIKRFSNWPTIPQVYVGGKFIGGGGIVRGKHARGGVAPPLRAAGAGRDAGGGPGRGGGGGGRAAPPAPPPRPPTPTPPPRPP